jgi:hypothetical protein
MSPSARRSSTTSKKPSFKPTVTFPEGDVILKSSDGIEFRVHKLLLRLASPIFAGMFEMPEPRRLRGEVQTVDMSEDARSLESLLRWIYPTNNPPTIESEEDLQALLPIALKYEVERILGGLRTYMTKRAGNNPLYFYALGIRYGYPDVVKAAAREVLLDRLNIFDIPSCDLNQEVKDVPYGDMKYLDEFTIKWVERKAHRDPKVLRLAMEDFKFPR